MNSTIELTVRNKDIHIRKSDKITTGQQLNKIDIFFDGDSWIKTEKKENGNIEIIEELKVDIVFRIDNRFYRVTAEEEPMKIPENKHLIIDIPPNVGAGINLGKVVFIGIRGVQEVGDTYQIVYPTPYFRLGVVEKGASPIDSLPPEKATQTAYDEAVKKANAAANAAELSKTNAEQSEAKAKTSETNAKASANAAEVSENNAKASEDKAAKSASDAQSASEKYPNIDAHGHWIRWDGTAWVDTGALAKFTIFKTYSTIEAMYADWKNIHNDYYNNFVLITSQPKANPGKDESIEDDNGKLFIILQEKKKDGNVYEENGFSYVGDLSGAQGIQGPKGDQGPQGEQGPTGPAGIYTAGDGISITNSISARLGSGLKFDTEKKITLDETAFTEYTENEITILYNHPDTV